MKSLALVSACLLFLLSAQRAQAIVVLPALILIPLAKIIAVVIASLSLPISSMGLLTAKVTRNRQLAFAVTIASFMVIGLITVILLRWLYPENPWF